MSGHRIFVGHSSAPAGPQTYDESGAFGAVAEIAGEAVVELQINGAFESVSSGDGAAVVELVGSGDFGAIAAVDGDGVFVPAGPPATTYDEAGDFGAVAGCDGDAAVVTGARSEPIGSYFSSAHPFGRGRRNAVPVEFGASMFGGGRMLSRLELHGRRLLGATVITGGSSSRSALCGTARIGGRLSGGGQMLSRLEPWERPNVEEENELLVTLLIGGLR